MFYVIAFLFFILAVVAVWAMLRFHNVLENQRFLNGSWMRIQDLLVIRNELLAHFQELWVRVMAQPEEVTVLQQALTNDAAHPWEDVTGRVATRTRIEQAAHELFRTCIAHEAAQRDAALREWRAQLAENTLALTQEVQAFNKIARLYNRQLKQPPNNFTSEHFGAIPIPTFPVEFHSF